MPATIRPLAPPHKGLRNALGLLSFYSGNCDYADLASVQRLKECALDFHALCIDHEANEKRYVFEPLPQRSEMNLELWRNEHKELHNFYYCGSNISCHPGNCRKIFKSSPRIARACRATNSTL